jgi:glyoxylase-like metal-dependent hydrolase (beta-lactamase superfamily II)
LRATVVGIITLHLTLGAENMTDELLPGRVYHLDLGAVNAYLLDDGETTLIDTGTPNALDDLRSELDEAGYTIDDIDRVLITHFDVDHVGTLAKLDFEGPVYAMEPDASFIDGSRKPPLSNHKGLLQRLADFLLPRPSKPVQRLEDGDSVAGFDAYHTPGHTPGHTVYLHDEFGVAFLGDLVSEENGALTTTPWIFTYNQSETADSVRALANRDLSFEIAAMGHGTPIIENGTEALDELAQQLN